MMRMTFKRAATAGFTLIELLIVVIILAILAAIAIPQFSASAGDAQRAALDANLAAVRNAIEQYRAQHTNFAFPGAAASTGNVACPAGGEPGTGAAGTVAAFQEQMRFPSNRAGQTCTVAGGEFRYGPYLRQGIPNEPINNSAAIVVQTTGAPIVAVAANGWAYDTVSGQFIMNSTALDPDNRAYSLR
ncbi:prepilin-type N-terminal cleavage/methylation domain-containing protein [Pseudoduganella sp. SL102]|uniref:type II secretion system protein n=1 Tax=Pseudoduganella sp. SL102 TaxID=2995154 RepID=UPI00248B6CC2|nr:prepilin-type N-terminal cleavage/methylation domain-containing protein [Pseudoduganella sp. SL102]WBS01065.1 prepilin-type N-terminal cleavage/methylation domain-containing protein [Pseudoduganella sp. SL102]